MPLALSICGLWIACLRVRTYNEPPERDLATYALFGHEILRGRSLYSALWDNKPPAIFWSYAFAELLVGYGKPSTFALGLAAALATLIGVYHAAAMQSRRAGLWAALLWTISCGDLELQANQPNVEVFLNALHVWAFVALARPGPQRGWSVLAAGILLGVASAYKHVSVFVAMSMASVLVARVASPREAFANLIRLAAPGLAIWAAMAASFAVNGRFPIFWRTVITYNSYYSGGIINNIVDSFGISNVHQISFKLVLYPMAGLSAVALVLLPRGGLRPLLAAWLIGTHVAIASPGQFFPHYYQLWLTPLAVASGYGIDIMFKFENNFFKLISGILVTSVVSAMVWILASDAPLPPKSWSIRKYGDVFVKVERLGRRLDALLQADETFYQWGEEAGLYTSSRRRPPAGVVWNKQLLSGPLAGELTARTLADLQRERPEVVVVYGWYNLPAASHPVYALIKQNYRPCASLTTDDATRIMIRIGGRLDHNNH